MRMVDTALMPFNAKALDRLFSTTVVRELCSDLRPYLFTKLMFESGVLERLQTGSTVADVFSVAFEALLKRDNRHEYVYKAALIEKIQHGTHSVRTACMLNEFRVDTSKADAVLFNGTATAYEIKSERDSLSRLPDQIDNFYKVFPNVNVIAGENHIGSILAKTPSHLGVMLLSRRYQISQVRTATPFYGKISARSILDCIQIKEAKIILENLGIEVPNVPNTMLRNEIMNLFQDVPMELLHVQMVRAVKENRSLMSLESYLSQIPVSLHSAVISSKVGKKMLPMLVKKLSAPIYKVV